MSHDPLDTAYRVVWVQELGGDVLVFDEEGVAFADANLSREAVSRALSLEAMRD